MSATTIETTTLVAAAEEFDSQIRVIKGGSSTP